MSTSLSSVKHQPHWMERVTRIANRPVIALQHLGVVFGPTSVLSIPGRKTGKLRAAPVAVLTVDDERYVIAVYQGTDWAANARAAGRGTLRHGRTEERVSLTELSLTEREALLRKLPTQAPEAGTFYRLRFGIDFEPDALAALAPRVRAFRVGQMPAG